MKCKYKDCTGLVEFVIEDGPEENTSAQGLFKSNLTKLSIGTEVTNVFPNAVYSNATLLVPGGSPHT